ncbi:MAG TPA: P-II family nitrogen regulator [Rhodospirillales bacterium]|nr:P-II family nitrogen regulator [Rhodospirillales bacterium]
MKLKLIMALVSVDRTGTVVEAAREAGATGATIITSVRGEGLKPQTTFLGLDLSGQRDVLLFMVAEQKARQILETIAEAGEFDSAPGAGVAFEISIDDAVGMSTQLPTLLEEIEDKL